MLESIMAAVIGHKRNNTTDKNIVMAVPLLPVGRDALLASLTEYLLRVFQKIEIDPSLFEGDSRDIDFEQLKLRTDLAMTLDKVHKALSNHILQTMLIQEAPSNDDAYWYVLSLLNTATKDAIKRYLAN